MSEDWLQKVHDRMSDYETDEPADLWIAIDNKYRDAAGKRQVPRRHVAQPRFRRYMAAAISAAAIIVGIALLTDKADIQQNLSTDNMPYATSAPAVASLTHPDRQQQESPAETLSPARVSAGSGSDTGSGSGQEPRDEITDTATPTADLDAAVDTTPSRHDPITQRHDDLPNTAGSATQPSTRHSYIASVSHRADHNGKTSLSLFTSGGPGSVFNSQSSSEHATAGSIGPAGAEWKDNPMLGIMAFNHGKEIKTEIRHRIPIRAGISVTYNLNDRIGIGTGLTYANLTSDITEGSDRHYYTGEQTLHYIGIPLNLKYRIFTLRRFDLYASTGILAEKCVSARIEKTFILDKQPKGSETADIPDKPLQWSANATLGLQYNIADAVGLYVEPGISYYFDDGSPISTIYKEKPVNFNLNLGLRFTFGR